jgi:hypothetical protein
VFHVNDLTALETMTGPGGIAHRAWIASSTWRALVPRLRAAGVHAAASMAAAATAAALVSAKATRAEVAAAIVSAGAAPRGNAVANATAACTQILNDGLAEAAALLLPAGAQPGALAPIYALAGAPAHAAAARNALRALIAAMPSPVVERVSQLREIAQRELGSVTVVHGVWNPLPAGPLKTTQEEIIVRHAKTSALMAREAVDYVGAVPNIGGLTGACTTASTNIGNEITAGTIAANCIVRCTAVVAAIDNLLLGLPGNVLESVLPELSLAAAEAEVTLANHNTAAALVHVAAVDDAASVVLAAVAASEVHNAAALVGPIGAVNTARANLGAANQANAATRARTTVTALHGLAAAIPCSPASRVTVLLHIADIELGLANAKTGTAAAMPHTNVVGTAATLAAGVCAGVPGANNGAVAAANAAAAAIATVGHNAGTSAALAATARNAIEALLGFLFTTHLFRERTSLKDVGCFPNVDIANNQLGYKNHAYDHILTLGVAKAREARAIDLVAATIPGYSGMDRTWFKPRFKVVAGTSDHLPVSIFVEV